jgi:hypothetical protein
MTSRPSDRRGACPRPRSGVALPAALGALALLGALSVAGVLATRDEGRAARALAAAVAARAAAEGALGEALARWPATRNTTLAIGATEAAPSTVAPSATVRATRLAPRAFLLDARATEPSGLPGAESIASRRLWLLVRLRHLTPALAGAITSAGHVEIDGGATVSGVDEPPPDWSDCASWSEAPAPVPAVAVPDRDSVSPAPDASLRGGLHAAPDVGRGATFDRFGESSWGVMAGAARVVLDGGATASPMPRTSAGVCVVDPASWGEPRRGHAAVASCERESPVVIARPPSLTLRGPARSQGLLLVDGDLHVEGPVEHTGLVVVRGIVRARAGALRVRGALMIANTNGRGTTVIGPGSEVTYSSCAVGRALIAASRPTPIRRRSWMEVTH